MKPVAQSLNCRTCNTGKLRKRKIYQFKWPMVFSGYAQLLPALFGLPLGIIVLIGAFVWPMFVTGEVNTGIRSTLKEKNVPEHVIDKLITNEAIDQATLANLTSEQRRILTASIDSRSLSTDGVLTASFVARVTGILLILGSLIAGFVGWILIQKKTVLQCDRCNATVSLL